jgi:hypothetical protein
MSPRQTRRWLAAPALPALPRSGVIEDLGGKTRHDSAPVTPGHPAKAVYFGPAGTCKSHP